MIRASRHIAFGLMLAWFAAFTAGSAAWSQENATYLSLDEILSFSESNVIWDSEATGWTETINVLVEVSGAASATGLGYQSLVGNTVFESGNHTAGITDSFNNNTGFMAVNQSSGSVNNQGNVTSIAIVGADKPALHVTQLAAVQELRGNTLDAGGTLSARIDNSFNDTVGVVAVNQAAGSLNQQLNMLSLTFGGGAAAIAPIVADSALAQVGSESDNILVEDVSPKEQGVSNSFNNFVGVAQGSSVAGNMNRVANLLSVSVQTIGGP